MKRKTRSSKEKLLIVLEGLKGTVPLAELCSRHAITQSQYYIWRDRLLKDGEAIFNFGGADKEQERLRSENSKLKGIIGELTVELKKNRGNIRSIVMRKQSQAIAKKNKALLSRIKAIKADHPAWGYRRVWAYLRYREGLLVNKKRIYRLLSQNNLLATQTRSNRAECVVKLI